MVKDDSLFLAFKTIEYILSVFLGKLDRFFDLILSLLKTPDVAESSMLSLPTLDVESGPKSDENDIGIVPYIVNFLVVAFNQSFAFLLILDSIRELHDE